MHIEETTCREVLCTAKPMPRLLPGWTYKLAAIWLCCQYSKISKSLKSEAWSLKPDVKCPHVRRKKHFRSNFVAHVAVILPPIYWSNLCRTHASYQTMKAMAILAILCLQATSTSHVNRMPQGLAISDTTTSDHDPLQHERSLNLMIQLDGQHEQGFQSAPKNDHHDPLSHLSENIDASSLHHGMRTCHNCSNPATRCESHLFPGILPWDTSFWQWLHYSSGLAPISHVNSHQNNGLAHRHWLFEVFRGKASKQGLWELLACKSCCGILPAGQGLPLANRCIKCKNTACFGWETRGCVYVFMCTTRMNTIMHFFSRLGNFTLSASTKKKTFSSAHRFGLLWLTHMHTYTHTHIKHTYMYQG